MALRASDSQRANERQWGGKRQSTQKERNNKDTRERLWLMEKLLQETDGRMQTARRSFQQLTASVCTSMWKGSNEPWAGGLVQSLQPAKDTIVTVIIQLQSRTISWVRSWGEIWAEAAHFIRNVDSFWLFFFFFCFWMALLKVVLFWNDCAYTETDPENETYLPAWLLSFGAPGQLQHRAACGEQSALQRGECQKFVMQVASLAEPKDSMLSIWEADTCYPLGVSTLFAIRLKCRYSRSVRYHQCGISNEKLLESPQTGIRCPLTYLFSVKVNVSV